MTTSFALNDTLPKDAGGAKVAALMDLATSQNDWAIIAGIGAKVANGKTYAAQYAGTALAGSKIETPTVGNLAMGALTTNPSATAFGNAIPIRADDRGQIFVSGLSATTCAFVATSHDTVTVASGILYRIVAAACGAIPGAQVRVQNGSASLTHVSFSQNSETIVVDFGTGCCFGSLVTERVNTTQSIFITAIYKPYGLG
jgi:hypothetical protein